MSTATIAALAAILGVVIGRLWDSRSESVRWQRDQRTASYRSLAEQFQVLNEVLRALATADPVVDSYPDRVDQVRIVDFKAWDSAYTAVWLYGTPHVVSIASALDAAVTKLFYDVIERRLSIQEWQQLRTCARAVFEQFISAIRDELRLPPVEASFFSYTSEPVDPPAPTR
ncbi:hypothetical protein [Nocardia sp. NPDC004711]